MTLSIFVCGLAVSSVGQDVTSPSRPPSIMEPLNRFYFPEEFRSLMMSYGSSPQGACTAFSRIVETRDYFETADRSTAACGWTSDLDETTGLSECEAEGFQAGDAATIPPACGNSGDDIFFMARGTEDWTASVRFKLNSSASKLEAHLALFALRIAQFYKQRGWQLPAEVRYRIEQGLSTEIQLNGVSLAFAREVGVRPRYNLTLSFGERPPFGLSVEATEDFQRQAN